MTQTIENIASMMTQAQVPGPDEFQTYLYDDDSDSGFIIRNEGGEVFKAEEWRHGDIVDNAYGTYDEVKAWTAREAEGHMAWRSGSGFGPSQNR